MDFALTEDQLMLKKSAREFLESEAPITLAQQMLSDESGFNAGLWAHMAELGWMGIAIPEADGGLGLGMLELALLLEEMGRLVVPSPFFSTVAMAAPLIAALADGEQRSGLLREIAAGTTKLTVARVEQDGWTGDDALATTAVQADGGGWTVTGTKMFVSDAQIADQILVVARTANGLSVLLVDVSGASGVTIQVQESLDPTRRLSTVVFDAAPGVLIGVEGGAARGIEAARDRIAVALAAEATGVSDAVMTRSVAYAKERQQFGRAIGSFQAIAHQCADMLIATESARSTTYYAAWALDEGAPDASLAAATAKAAASTAAMRTAESGIQVHGGIGFTWEHEMHLYYRRAKLTELFGGSAAVWRERIASLLAG